MGDRIIVDGSIMSTSNQTKTSRYLSYAGIAFSVVGLLLSALLICKHVFPELCGGASMGCDINGIDGCSELGKSQASKLFGLIPLAIPGFFYYSLMGLLYFRISTESEKIKRAGLAQVLLAMATFGFVMDLLLGYVNLFKLDVPCLLCVYTYLATLGVAIMALLTYRLEVSDESEKTLKVFIKGIQIGIPPAVYSLALTFAVITGFTLASVTVGAPASDGSPLLPKSEVSGLLKDFRALNTVDLKIEGLNQVDGSDAAYIIIHEFADFNCPHCFHGSELLEKAQKRWPGRIRIYYRHFPLDGTCNPLIKHARPDASSCNGAQASLCATEQNLFPELYHRIFDFQLTRTSISPDALQEVVTNMGGNWNQMLQCMGSKATNNALLHDIEDAKVVQLSGTPTFVIDNRVLPSGVPDEGFFYSLLDALVYEKEGDVGYKEFADRIKK